MPPVCQVAGVSIIACSALSWITERHYTGPLWAPKELKIVFTLFKNEFHSHSNAPKSVIGWGSVPDPQIKKESA